MSARLTLDIWLDGFDRPTGTLTAQDDGTLGFRYRDAYLERDNAVPLSLCLPLGVAAHDAVARAFFGNLLPENDQMQRMIDREGLDHGDIAAILHHVGADCPGAISCLPEGSGPAKIPGHLATDYRALGEDELSAIVTSLADRQRLPDGVKDPSPVAGVQRKIAVTLDQDGRIALPRNGLRVPTTHILKVPSRAEANDVLHEMTCCRLAAAVGLDASVPQAVEIGGVQALLITRFDRVVTDGIVTRIHQEDFAQALALPPLLKYERNGTEGRRFDITAIAALLDRTAVPAEARQAFLLATLFQLAVGNSDNHAKNHGLLYDRGPVPRLAPLYDILPILLDDRYHHDLAFRMGEAEAAAGLTPPDIEAFFAALGLRKGAARRFIEGPARTMLLALDRATSDLAARGMKRLDDLIGRELDILADALDLILPLRQRDYFQAGAGGGWGS